MPEVRVVVRHTGRRGDYDLAIDGAACGPLPAAGERWLSVEPGPHSLFVNSRRFRKGIIKAFVAAPGADVCLWVESGGITREPRFVEPQPAGPVPPRTIASWYERLLPPFAVVTILSAFHSLTTRQSLLGWTVIAAGTAVGASCLLAMWALRPPHRWHALALGTLVLLMVLLGTAALPLDKVVSVSRLIAAIVLATFTFVVATRRRRG